MRASLLTIILFIFISLLFLKRYFHAPHGRARFKTVLIPTSNMITLEVESSDTINNGISKV